VSASSGRYYNTWIEQRGRTDGARPSMRYGLVVDFNRAYNPPCVFSPYATCSLPWPANRLPIRIEAGERAYRSH